MPDQRNVLALEVAERIAEGLADDTERRRKSDTLRGIPDGHVSGVLLYDPFSAATSCAAITVDAVAITQRSSERIAQVALLRDIFGNPFRPATLNPSWRTSDVLLLAGGIYDDRAFDRMPILADALQDAGCDNEELNHCRDTKQSHVRGCWAVDLVLGKSQGGTRLACEARSHQSRYR
jgi:hypothetical protein